MGTPSRAPTSISYKEGTRTLSLVQNKYQAGHQTMRKGFSEEEEQRRFRYWWWNILLVGVLVTAACWFAVGFVVLLFPGPSGVLLVAAERQERETCQNLEDCGPVQIGPESIIVLVAATGQVSAQKAPQGKHHAQAKLNLRSY